MTEKAENNSGLGWTVFLDSLAKQVRPEAPFPGAEITKQLETEWEPYLTLATEVIQ